MLSPTKTSTDILLWVECYSSLIAVLATKYPTNTPEFMAYLKTIVHASKSFLGDGWVTYDSCYRRKAAVTKSLNWSQVNFTLYNETFAGRAKIMPRCKFCNSELHHSADCSKNITQASHQPSIEIGSKQPGHPTMSVTCTITSWGTDAGSHPAGSYISVRVQGSTPGLTVSLEAPTTKDYQIRVTCGKKRLSVEFQRT